MNLSNLSNTVLTYSICISSYLWVCLTSDNDTKSSNKDIYIVTASIVSICAKATFIGNTYTIDT